MAPHTICLFHGMVFSTDEMMTPIKRLFAGVFPPTKMADRT